MNNEDFACYTDDNTPYVKVEGVKQVAESLKEVAN